MIIFFNLDMLIYGLGGNSPFDFSFLILGLLNSKLGEGIAAASKVLG